MKSRKPSKTTALQKVGTDAADAEYARMFGFWFHLLGAVRPRIVFEPSGMGPGSFQAETLDAQAMRVGESYLIVDAVVGTAVGAVKGVDALSIGGRLPIPGRLYHLIRMGQA